MYYRETKKEQASTHTQNYLRPCSRIRPVSDEVRKLEDVVAVKRYNLKYAAIWGVSTRREIVACSDRSHP